MEKYRLYILIVVVAVIVGALYFLTDTQTGIARKAEIQLPSVAEKDALYPKAREIVDPQGFINSPNGDDAPFTISEMIGKKVILVDFWTYSCINCQRTQPYLNAWYEKYKDQGLEIVGVHTPEFEFEKIYANVLGATKDAGIQYPVVLDSNYGTWAAYQNSYWPRKYLIDSDGYIVYDHIGEGGYEETERVIQALLAERMARMGEGGEVSSDVVNVQAPAITDRNPRTPETYFGAWRNFSYLGNATGGVIGVQDLTLPASMSTHKTYLSGTWDIQKEFARGGAGSGIHLKFQAKDVYMVASSEEGATIRVLIDGKSARGRDVTGGTVQIDAERLYYLIEESSWGEHDLEIIVEDGTLDAFTFTFG